MIWKDSIAVYEGGFTEIQSIIDDPDLTSRRESR